MAQYKYTADQLRARRDAAEELQDLGLVHADQFITFCDYVLGD